MNRTWLGLLLLTGCFSTHEPPSAEGRLWSPDAGTDSGPLERCSRRLLTASEMMSETYAVQSANCSGRMQDVRVRFVGRSSGVVEVVHEFSGIPSRLDVWPSAARFSCEIQDASRFVVSRGGGLEVDMRCDDGIDRRANLRLFADSCEGLSAELTVDSRSEWAGGCGEWIWTQVSS